MEETMELPFPELESTNTFRLNLVVQGFVLKESSGRKSYVKGKTIRWNVNSDDFRMHVLMDGLSAELRVGMDQCITVWKKGKDGDTTDGDGDAADDEVLINLIGKKARTTPQKPNTPAKKKTTQEKANKKILVKKPTTQEKAKKGTW